LLATVAIALWSCQGITSNVETLRAEHLEIVDKEGALQMDVAVKIKALEERVKKLEGALESRQAVPAPPPSATATVSTPAPTTSAPPPAASSAGRAAPPKPAPPRSSSAPRAPGAPEIF